MIYRILIVLLLTATLAQARDLRPDRIERFLERYCPTSPLRGYGQEIVKQSDRYKLDYRLYVALAGAESTWGKHCPKRSSNFTGISNGGARFRSIKHNIEFTIATIAEKKWYRKFRKTKNLMDLIVVYKAVPPFDRYQRSLNFTMDMIAGLPESELTGHKVAVLTETKVKPKPRTGVKKARPVTGPDRLIAWNYVPYAKLGVRKLTTYR
ncbi:MAG: hypothetical protein MUC35_04700 [Candidatus Margulisbacteria bacterium]|jgi:pyruvate carboxylase|nr:hypothetical protein [Candidatus Margulisiibacteriota bacterium]